MQKRKRGISLCKNLQSSNQNNNTPRHSIDIGILKTKQLCSMTQQQKQKHFWKLKLQMQELDQQIKLLSQNQTHINYLENRSNALSNNRQRYNMSLRQSNASNQRYPVTERPNSNCQRNQLDQINWNHRNYGPIINPFNMYNQGFQTAPYTNVTPLRQISQNYYSSYHPSTARNTLHYPRPIPPLTPQILQAFKQSNIIPVNTNIYSSDNNTKNKYSTINTNKTANKQPQVQRNIKNEASNKNYKNHSNNKYSRNNFTKNSPQTNKKDQQKYNNNRYNNSNNKSPSKYQKNKSPQKKKQFEIIQSSPSFSKQKSPSRYQSKSYAYKYQDKHDPKLQNKNRYQNKSNPKVQNKNRYEDKRDPKMYNAKINEDKHDTKRGTNFYDTSYRYQQYPLKSGDKIKKQIQKEVKKQISPARNKYTSPPKNIPQKFSFQNNYPNYEKEKALNNINNIINQKNNQIPQSPIISLNKLESNPHINKVNKKQQQKPLNRNQKKNQINKNKSMDRKVIKNQPSKR